MIFIVSSILVWFGVYLSLDLAFRIAEKIDLFRSGRLGLIIREPADAGVPPPANPDHCQGMIQHCRNSVKETRSRRLNTTLPGA
ncbi:MAG: hypothetical protein QGH73_18005, partial [Rhodospirillales bacterium]|nr:hypothetical protein [Rhodospirillales bacterium]